MMFSRLKEAAVVTVSPAPPQGFWAIVQRVTIIVSLLGGSLGVAAHGVAYAHSQMNKARENERIVMRLTAVEVIAKDCEDKLTHLDDRYVPKAVLDEREKHVTDLAAQVTHVQNTLEVMNEAITRLVSLQTRLVSSQVQTHR